MSERLAELKRQRDLVAAHLAWIEREITLSAGPNPRDRESNAPSLKPIASSPPQVNARSHSALSPAVTPSASVNPDEIFAQFQQEDARGGQISRRGCWTLFYGLLLVGVAGVAAVIFLRYGG